MITFFNRRKLMTDVGSGALVTAREKLKAAGIAAELKTIRSRGVLSMMSDAAVHARYNIPAGTAPMQIAFTYILYVRHKDYRRAKDLLKI